MKEGFRLGRGLDSDDEQRLGVEFAELDELARTCDIVSVHVSVTDQARGMIDAESIERMKPGVILINTARGEVVDNGAMPGTPMRMA